MISVRGCEGSQRVRIAYTAGIPEEAVPPRRIWVEGSPSGLMSTALSAMEVTCIINSGEGRWGSPSPRRASAGNAWRGCMSSRCLLPAGWLFA